LRRRCNGAHRSPAGDLLGRQGSILCVPGSKSSIPDAVVLNPRDDERFVAYAEGILGEGGTTPDAFQARLRERYPAAVVRPRGLASEPFTLWYCYRDGTWTQPW
jgi:hypothetical protein